MRVTKRSKVALVLLGLMFLYVLLAGPAYRLMRKNVIPPKVLTAVYYPVIWACWHSRFIDDQFHTYESLWYDDTKVMIDEMKKGLTNDYIVK